MDWMPEKMEFMSFNDVKGACKEDLEQEVFRLQQLLYSALQLRYNVTSEPERVMRKYGYFHDCVWAEGVACALEAATSFEVSPMARYTENQGNGYFDGLGEDEYGKRAEAVREMYGLGGVRAF